MQVSECKKSSINETIWCEPCEKYNTSKCNLHELHRINNRVIPPKAKLTIPSVLQYKKVENRLDKKQNFGIFTKKTIEKNTQFGPLEANEKKTGSNVKKIGNIMCYKIFDNYGCCLYELDINDSKKCNWLMYLQMGEFVEESNVVAYQENRQIFFVTNKIINVNCELIVWYSNYYRRLMQIDPLLTKNQFDNLRSINEDNVLMNKKKTSNEKKKATWADRKTLRCDKCNSCFATKSRLQSHMNMHTGERPYKCQYCNKAFSSKYKLERHSLSHKEKKIVCPKCTKMFFRKDHLQSHMNIHDPMKQTYTCEKCKKVYLSNLSYKSHLSYHSIENGEFLCCICNKTFENKEEIDFHLKKHLGSRTLLTDKDKKHACGSCSKRFVSKKDLVRHSVVHTKRKDFLCQHCPQTFGRQDHLSRHIKKAHAKEDKDEMFSNDTVLILQDAAKSVGIHPEQTNLTQSFVSEQYFIINNTINDDEQCIIINSTDDDNFSNLHQN